MLVSINVSTITELIFFNDGTFYYEKPCGYLVADKLLKKTFKEGWQLLIPESILRKLATPNFEYGLEYKEIVLIQIRERATIYALTKNCDDYFSEYELIVVTIDGIVIDSLEGETISVLQELNLNNLGAELSTYELPDRRYLNDTIVL